MCLTVCPYYSGRFGDRDDSPLRNPYDKTSFYCSGPFLNRGFEFPRHTQVIAWGLNTPISLAGDTSALRVQ